ncbi:MAG: hypothetical protein IH950_09090 [Bacteroidetes bacterium]|nr:hypothetical protein [Bacteroidota bacterium]MCH8033893.1 hypothetical protein [Bacteroidota bacterium]
MFMKKPRHRIFDYTPRHYKPEYDKTERTKRRLGFSRQRKYRSRQRSPIILLVIVAIIIYLILKLSGSV